MAEKQSTKEAELHQVKEELATVKLQLAKAEKEKAKAFAELRGTKKLLVEMAKMEYRDPCSANQSQISDTFSIHAMQQDNQNTDVSEKKDDAAITDGLDQEKRNMDVLKQSNTNTEEKHIVGEVQLKVAQEQHMNAVAELESVKKELEKLKEELEVSLKDKENALRQAEEALVSAELNARRVEELSHEVSGTNESLVLVKLACIEANKERAALLAAKSGAAQDHQNVAAKHDMDAIQDLEIKLALATNELIRLRQELATAKEAEVKVATAASEAYANLANAKSELEKMRIQTSSMSGSSCTLSAELKMTKRELEKALENGASLQAAMDALQGELQNMRKELADLREREANASAAVVTINAELLRTKMELASAMAAETKAKESILGLTQTLQQIRVEADEAKVNANASKEEVTQAKADAEQAKAAMASAESEVEAAMKAAEAAKLAESEALEKFNALSEMMSGVRASGVEGGAGMSISQDEYDQLKKKVAEAEELANMRVVAANAHVEAVRMGELELQQQLKALNDDIETMKSNTEQALQRAEMAESAKLAVESEMRKWRKKQQNAKGVEREMDSSSQRGYGKGDEREVGSSSSSQYAKMMVSRSQALSFPRPQQPTESLAHILNMKMPSLASEARALSDRTLGQKKKKHYLPGLNIFSGKKNQSLASNLVET
eukprot:c23153_g2_i1 orf=582-2597(+)